MELNFILRETSVFVETSFKLNFVFIYFIVKYIQITKSVMYPLHHFFAHFMYFKIFLNISGTL